MAPSVTALDELKDAVFAAGNVSVDDVDLDFNDKPAVQALLQGSLIRTHSGFIALPVKSVLKSDSSLNVMPTGGAPPMVGMKIVDFKAIAETIVVGKLTLGGKMAAGAAAVSFRNVEYALHPVAVAYAVGVMVILEPSLPALPLHCPTCLTSSPLRLLI